jgi:hypothetical protein
VKDSADLTIRHSQGPRLRGTAFDAATQRRFSPLNAPQRAAVDAFCAESRPWALRQAARTYRHLPVELREQAVDAAMRELRTGAPVAVDRRTLHRELADELTTALREVHIGWCLNQSSTLFRDVETEAPAQGPDGQAVARFLEDGLCGLERAVLQLEIGAGRDTRTARAALRLGPRQYARHREEGLSKLRDAITGTVAGHVCDDHVRAVVLAATGDGAAADALAGGTTRCRACSREAQGLRRLLHERLALAPWPFVIKPAGVLAAKAAAIAAAVGGKGASAGAGGLAAGFGGGSIGSGASVVATVLAASAVATGGVAAIHQDVTPRALSATAAHVAPAQVAKTVATSPASAKPAAATHPTRHTARRHAAAKRHAGTVRHRARRHHAPVTSPSAASTTSGAATPAATSAPTTVVTQTTQTVQKVARDTVDKVQTTVGKVTKPLAPQLAKPVDDVIDRTQDTVDQLTNAVGTLLQPKK